MKVTTVNVNGVRAAFRKGFGDWLDNDDSDLLCLQEVRATPADTQDLFGPAWDVRVWPCRVKGRAGVALGARRDSGWEIGQVTEGRPPECYAEIGGEPDVDSGRWLEGVIHGPHGATFTLVSAYLHSGELNTEKQEQKLAYLNRVGKRVNQLGARAVAGAGSDAPQEALICGDFNIVRTARDIKNWKPNHNKTSGVMDEEIAFLDAWMADTLSGSDGVPCVDVGRALAGDVDGPYTWWSWRGKAYDNNAGWRLDYHMATPGLAGKALLAAVYRAPAYDARFTDHAPLTVAYDFPE